MTDTVAEPLAIQFEQNGYSLEAIDNPQETISQTKVAFPGINGNRGLSLWELRKGTQLQAQIVFQLALDGCAHLSWKMFTPSDLRPVREALRSVITAALDNGSVNQLIHLGSVEDFDDLQLSRTLGFVLEGTQRTSSPQANPPFDTWWRSVRLSSDRVGHSNSKLTANLIDGSRPAHLVAQFHDVYELPNMVAEGSVATVDYSRVHLRMSLIKEEFAELCGAVYGPEAETALLELFPSLPDCNNRDVVESADALADLVYVIYGMALESGIDLDRVLSEVHRSNLSKLMPDGSVRRREDGKILKGPDFSEPDIASTLSLE